jgi:hypothetical protein
LHYIDTMRSYTVNSAPVYVRCLSGSSIVRFVKLAENRCIIAIEFYSLSKDVEDSSSVGSVPRWLSYDS